MIGHRVVRVQHVLLDRGGRAIGRGADGEPPGVEVEFDHHTHGDQVPSDGLTAGMRGEETEAEKDFVRLGGGAGVLVDPVQLLVGSADGHCVAVTQGPRLPLGQPLLEQVLQLRMLLEQELFGDRLLHAVVADHVDGAHRAGTERGPVSLGPPQLCRTQPHPQRGRRRRWCFTLNTVHAEPHVGVWVAVAADNARNFGQLREPQHAAVGAQVPRDSGAQPLELLEEVEHARRALRQPVVGSAVLIIAGHGAFAFPRDCPGCRTYLRNPTSSGRAQPMRQPGTFAHAAERVVCGRPGTLPMMGLLENRA